MVNGKPGFRSIPVSIEFEVVGKTQGLYFLKNCMDECNKLGISGWIKSTRRGTIIGKIQGAKTNVEHILSWLKRGLPGSRIDHCYLYNFQYLSYPEFRGFTIRF